MRSPKISGHALWTIVEAARLDGVRVKTLLAGLIVEPRQIDHRSWYSWNTLTTFLARVARVRGAPTWWDRTGDPQLLLPDPAEFIAEAPHATLLLLIREGLANHFAGIGINADLIDVGRARVVVEIPSEAAPSPEFLHGWAAVLGMLARSVVRSTAEVGYVITPRRGVFDLHLVPTLVRDIEVGGGRWADVRLSAALTAVSSAAFLVHPGNRIEAVTLEGEQLLRRDATLAQKIARAGDSEGRSSGFSVIYFGIGARTSLLVIFQDGVTALGRRTERCRTLWRLTERQSEVLPRVARGLTNKEIASELCCADKTIEVHVSALLEKSRCAARGQLMAMFWSYEE